MQNSLQKPQSYDKLSDIYLEDTIETIKFEKDALEIKFRHNISQLALKNIQLSNILKELATKQQQELSNECQNFKQMINTCISIQDALVGLETLEKKTQILKKQVFLLSQKLNA